MRFLVDAQLPAALARSLTASGHEAAHVGDLGLERATDAAIWSRAIALGSIIVTKDEDFARRRSFALKGPVVVWIRLRNTRKAELLRWFEAALPRILEALARGETLIEAA